MPHPKDSLPAAMKSVNEILPDILDTGALLTMTIDELEAEARTKKIPLPKRDKYSVDERREILIAQLASWIPELTPAQKRAQEIQHDFANAAASGEQLGFPYAPMQPEMARVSPFFVMSKKDMSKRPYIQGAVFQKGAHGTLSYSGPKLSTYDEDMLIAVLSLLREAENRDARVTGRARVTTYKGSLKKILTRAGYPIGGGGYKAALQSLVYLHGAVIKITTKRGAWSMDNILTHSDGSAGDECTIVVNDYFYEAFVPQAGDYIALFDVDKRKNLSPIGKALFRIVTAQSDEGPGTPCYKNRYEALANLMNLNPELPDKEMRRHIRRAIEENIKCKVIAQNSQLFKNGLVVLYHHAEMKKRKANNLLENK